MYNVHDTMLGETPSFLDSLGNFLSNGVTAGFNIYNRVQNIQQQKTQTAQLQQVARTANIAYTQPMTGVQPYMVSQSGGLLSGWTVPLLVGAGALGLIFILKK